MKDKILEILSKTYLMSLAVVDDGGAWVSDVIFIHDENLNIYWMSDPDVRHSQAILKNSKVAGTITTTVKNTEKGLGIQFSGNAEKIEGPNYDLACKHYEKRGKAKPKENEDILEGDSWYKLTPNKIELIDEESFGFKKQEINFLI